MHRDNLLDESVQLKRLPDGTKVTSSAQMVGEAVSESGIGTISSNFPCSFGTKPSFLGFSFLASGPFLSTNGLLILFSMSRSPLLFLKGSRARSSLLLLELSSRGSSLSSSSICLLISDYLLIGESSQILETGDFRNKSNDPSSA